MYTPFQPTLTAQGMEYFGLSVEMCSPTPALSNSILAFLQVDIDKPTPYPIVPDGTNVLFFSVHSGLVGGTRLSILEVQLMAPGEYFGVWFKPGTLRQFFDVDLTDITQTVVDDDFLSNRNFAYLNERLYEKHSFLERVALCESLFLKTVLRQPRPEISHALMLIYQSFGSITVEALAARVDLSSRQLNRLFSLHTGLSTKSFTQIIRIQALLRGCYEDKLSTFHRGLDLGFYDQSHLSKSLARHSLDSLSLKAKVLMSDFYKPHSSKTS